MRKILLILFCAAAVPAASAQIYQNNIFGFRAGLNVASLADDEWGARYDNRPAKFGWQIGIADQILLSQTLPFYFETGLYLSNKGGKWADSQTSGDDVERESVTLGMTYLQIPLKLNYHIAVEEFSIEPYLGFHYALGLWGRSVVWDDDVKTVQKKLYDTGDFKRSDVGMSLGVGASWSHFYASIGWECGFLNISNRPGTKTRNTSNFMIVAGYDF